MTNDDIKNAKASVDELICYVDTLRYLSEPANNVCINGPGLESLLLFIAERLEMTKGCFDV